MPSRVMLLQKARPMVIIAGVVLLGAAAVFAVAKGPDLASLAAFGYPGIAILMFLASTTIVLPAPGFAAVFAAGTVWNPLLVGVFAGVGAATGELTGYVLGMGGGAVLHTRDGTHWKRMRGWLEKYGVVAILLIAFIPNPFFDVMGVVAGSLGYSMRKFWISCAIGKTFKYAAIAYLSNSAAAWWVWH